MEIEEVRSLRAPEFMKHRPTTQRLLPLPLSISQWSSPPLDIVGAQAIQLGSGKTYVRGLWWTQVSGGRCFVNASVCHKESCRKKAFTCELCVVC